MKIHNVELLDNFYKHDKINVAILTDIYLPFIGGAGMVTDNLANSLHINKDTNVVLITGNVKNYEDKVDYPVIRCKSMPIPKAWGDSLPLPNFDKKLTRLLKSLKIDVIHIHSIFGLCNYGLKFAKNNHIPVVMHCHSKFSEEFPTIIKFKPITNFLIKRAYKLMNKSDIVFAVSENTKENLLQHNVISPIKVISNATDLTENLNNEKQIKSIEEKYDLKNKENILLFVGRIELEYKNLKFLLNSLGNLKKLNIQFKFLMIGTGPDEDKVKKIINNLNLNDNVILIGKITDRELLKSFYYKSDLFLFPSIRDTFGLVKLEAASQGTPTICLKNTAVSEGIIDNFNGYLANYNEEDFANKIYQILTNKEKLIEISNNAKKLVITWDEVGQECINQYKLLLKNKSA